MKNKAIFFDKENTLIKDNGYDPNFNESLIFDDVLEGLFFLKEREYLLFIITNQSGINRGFFSKDIFDQNMKKFINYFLLNGIVFINYFYCPHMPEENCNCRKPEVLNIKRAEALYNIDLSKSYIIGDRISDVYLGINCGMNIIFVERGYPEIEKNKKRFDSKKDYLLEEELIKKYNIVKIKDFKYLYKYIV
ncbi:MAG: HAD-IIIA family hydrolase [Spirochaetes bacterium]|nr:HAD-IIIA family hydrolase [Spirochaetota bacterium]